MRRARAPLASILFGLIDGSCDAAGFLVLHGIMPANITGDFVLLSANWVHGHYYSEIGRMITIPVFMLWAWGGRVGAGALKRRGWPALKMLLWATVGLLTAFAVLGLTYGPFRAQASKNTLIVAMIGVTAMALLNAVARMTPILAAGTTAMTGNTVKMLMDFAEINLGEREKEPKLLQDSGRLALTIAAFAGGCALSALVYWKEGHWCMLLPFGFAMAIVALGLQTTE